MLLYRVCASWRHGVLAVLVCTAVLSAGCAETRQAKKDPFFEKWRLAAERSRGHSSVQAAAHPPYASTMREPATPAVEAVPAERALPKARVTLHMRKAGVVVVLRALARAVGQNLLINSSVKGEVSVHVEDVPWDQAFLGILRLQGLIYEWQGDILRIMDLEDMQRDLDIGSLGEKKKTQQILAGRVEPLDTRVVPVHFADPLKLRANLEVFLSRDKEGNPRGSVMVDEHNNALILQATGEDLDKMLRLVSQLDKSTPQIRIEANIVETNRSTARDLGIQWGGIYARLDAADKGGLYITPGGTGGSATSHSAPLEGRYSPAQGRPGISGQGAGVHFPAALQTEAGASLGLLFGTIGSNILEMQLTALQQQGKINILSSPSITTLDNQTAYTENGMRVPYVAIGDQGEREVRFEDAVLRLEITPHVVDRSHLKMRVLVKKDEVDFTNDVEGNPFIFKKQTMTNLIVRNGETIVISGLSKSRETQSDRGVPWLMDVPVLGWFFKGQGKKNDMEEVLIFITPHVLDPFDEPGGMHGSLPGYETSGLRRLDPSSR